MKKQFRFSVLLAAALLLAVCLAGWEAAEHRWEEEQEEEWLEEKFYFDTLEFDVRSEEGSRISYDEGIKGFRDWVGNRLYVFLPSYAVQRPLQITWRFADVLLVNGEEQRNGGALENIAYNFEYLFEFQKDGEVKETCTVVFLCSQNLPAIFVETESGSMDTVNADRENREEGLFCLVEADGSVACIDELSYIKGRGNTTWEQDKKPYSIKLKNEYDILGMGASRRWELLANFYDGSHMRNALALEMAQEAGMEGTPQAAWADLYLNGEYQGLYQITERVEIAENRLEIPDQEKGKGDISGSYLFMMEDAGRFEDAVSRFQTGGSQTLVIKNPEEAGEEQVSYISGLVQEFEDALTAEDGIHPQTGKHYTEYIDLDSFVKKYLIEEIAKNSDAVTNSQYFYKKPDSVSTLLFAGPVWDYDNAFGHTNEEAMDPVGLMLDKVRSEEGSNLWYGTLCGHSDFSDRVKELYQEMFAPLLEELAEEKIEEWRELLRVSATLDWIRWKDTDKSFRYKVCGSYDEYVDYLQAFVRERKDFLDSVYVEGESWQRIRFVRGDPFGYVDLYTKKGSGGRQAPDSSDIVWEGEHITGWYYEDGTPYDPARVVEEDVTVYAYWEALEDSSQAEE